jgi:hypothetical protein
VKLNTHVHLVPGFKIRGLWLNKMSMISDFLTDVITYCLLEAGIAQSV